MAAKAGRSTANITTAGTVGGPYVLAHSDSFHKHSHILAKRSAASVSAASGDSRMYWYQSCHWRSQGLVPPLLEAYSIGYSK